MSVTSLGKYDFPPADAVENFHGNQLVYLAWDEHLMFCSPTAYPLPPEMPFRALVEQVITGTYGLHPDFAAIDWEQVEWLIDGREAHPDPDASLADNGIGHKSIVRFRTPGLNGIKGSGS